ncbi:MAG: hypothetical protein HOE62_21760 [Alphaproteobacteria bacterium]|nr:hypothetical protein [Alphaproteobacteria bacterium]MBT4020593.1 hypothetical protein [Alphaproteobacteria bacterium]MBT4967267.1 hypothetical protein [Alphaproteobacteria bacterium]MBT5160490.1 hypothetical protein [Alphaproteobacteria bacterium]MBT5917444.1 hypothetical protein [Alphaproteobacteria bacterium]
MSKATPKTVTDVLTSDFYFTPQALATNDAALYVGATSVRQFRAEVKRGLWPQPTSPESKPHRWSVCQLDKALKGELTVSTAKHLTPPEGRLYAALMPVLRVDW